MNISLTPDQQSALEKLQSFFQSDDHVFLLKGSAGSGKTTLLKTVIDILKQNGNSFRLMAPTGRASFILKERTGNDAYTIHKSIYNFSKLEEKDEDGRFQFHYKINENTKSLRTIYFVDEASMVSDVYSENEFFKLGSGYLMKDFFEYCDPVRKHNKIVFIGDYAQLPPVDMNFSPALSEKYISERYGLSVVSCMMTQVVRHAADSGIYANAAKIRQSIEVERYNEFGINDKVGEVSKVEMFGLVQEYCRQVKNLPDKNAIIITHSNKQSLMYNQMVRKFIFNNHEHLNVGDLLLITRNNYSYSVDIFNGTIVRLLAMGEPEHREIRFYGKNGIKEKVNIIFRDVLIEIPSLQGIETIKCKILDQFVTAENAQLDAKTQQALYVDFKMRMELKGIKPGTDLFKEEIRKDPYFNALQCKYGYAVTCHKSQGGEWEKVLVDLDVFIGKQTNTFFRWVYTAVTRSKHQLWHTNTPEFSAISRYIVKPIQKINTGEVNFYYPKELSFLDWRWGNIKRLCSENEIEVTENRAFSYQHIFTFARNQETCSLQLWYNNNFYSKDAVVMYSSNDEIRELCLHLTEASLMSDEIPFQIIGGFDFKQKMHDFFKSVCNEADVSITNIVQRQWSDRYYLKAKAQTAYIEFFYNDKHIYTFAQPKSTDGEEDEILKKIIQKIS